MLVSKRVRLKKALLAVRPPADKSMDNPRRTFDRLKAPPGIVRIPTDLARWGWALREARDILELHDVATETILPAPYFDVTGTSTYKRPYVKVGQDREESFESIPCGRVINWEFVLSSSVPPHVMDDGFSRPCEESELDSMLEVIGERFGMSQWGHAYLFGTFSLCNDRFVAPWTPRQVEYLTRKQNTGDPYTCVCGAPMTVESRGMKCSKKSCKHRQTWCHAADAGGR